MKHFFTLIELIVVIAVLGILAAIIIPNISNFQEEANDTAIASNVRNLQTSVDMFAMENYNAVPTIDQPTENVPQPIDFGQVYPDYTRDLPETEGVKYWIDFNGKVWASTVDAPTGVEYDTVNLKWNGVENAAYYNVFKTTSNITSNVDKKKMVFIQKVEDSSSQITIPMPNLKAGEEYLVNAVDNNKFESAPSGSGYTGYENNVPIAMIGMTPDTNIKSTTNISWNYSGSTDPDGDSIVSAEWEVNGNPVTNPPATFTSGNHVVKLRVKDSKGNWSSWQTKNFSVQEDALVPIGTGFAFTNAGATGRYGPSQSQLDSTYNNTLLQGKVTSNSGVQLWTVPETGTYRIETYGAKGGSTLTTNEYGGSGAIIKGDFNLTKGQNIYIAVGQIGGAYGYTGGGGGGTFVATGSSLSNSSPLIVAGGGGGAGNSGGNGRNASTGECGTNGYPSYGYGCNGYSNSSDANGGWGQAGAGFYGNGNGRQTTAYWGDGLVAVSFINIPVGAQESIDELNRNYLSSCSGAWGGFGGGASGACNGGGGGGGYSGGGQGGGGGGSYNSGSNQSNSVGNNGHGKVTITRIK